MMQDPSLIHLKLHALQLLLSSASLTPCAHPAEDHLGQSRQVRGQELQNLVPGEQCGLSSLSLPHELGPIANLPWLLGPVGRAVLYFYESELETECAAGQMM